MQVTRRLGSLCLLGQLLCWFALACVVAVIIWMSFDRAELALVATGLEAKLPREPEPHLLYAAFAVAIVPAGLTSAAFIHLAWLFRAMGSGGFLNAATRRVLNRIGWLALAAVISGVFTRTLMIFILSLQNPPGERLLSIGLNSNDFFVILLALIFFIFAQVQAEMARLDADVKSII